MYYKVMTLMVSIMTFRKVANFLRKFLPVRFPSTWLHSSDNLHILKTFVFVCIFVLNIKPRKLNCQLKLAEEEIFYVNHLIHGYILEQPTCIFYDWLVFNSFIKLWLFWKISSSDTFSVTHLFGRLQSQRETAKAEERRPLSCSFFPIT